VLCDDSVWHKAKGKTPLSRIKPRRVHGGEGSLDCKGLGGGVAVALYYSLENFGCYERGERENVER